MSDEQYERLFRLAMGSKRYKYNDDDDLIGRGLAVIVPRPHPTDRRTAITASGIQRLRDRLLFAEGRLSEINEEIT